MVVWRCLVWRDIVRRIILVCLTWLAVGLTIALSALLDSE
jgi:hypothetical protein